MIEEGKSTCPICKRRWIVTPLDDCFLPSCGCFGYDTSRNNASRPCEICGMSHARNCDKMPSRYNKSIEPTDYRETLGETYGISRK